MGPFLEPVREHGKNRDNLIDVMLDSSSISIDPIKPNDETTIPRHSFKISTLSLPPVITCLLFFFYCEFVPFVILSSNNTTTLEK